ncbi:MAG: DUF1080 domain-containing protein, partial [Gemmataceae bacterium]|nr:DUF1080 domain-containing protein [Gemmataceae bacterium]
MKRMLVPMVVVSVLAGAGHGVVGGENAKTVHLFNGKDLTGWKLKGDAKRSQWQVGFAEIDVKTPSQLLLVPSASESGLRQLINLKTGVDIYSEEKFGDCIIDLEVMVPKGSNSGIYVMGEYEVQILDSFGRAKVGPGDMGGLYGAAAPRVNACKKPGEWQRFVIDFQAPRFADGKKTANAKFLKVALNGEVIHENVEMKGPTPSGLTGKEAATGPLMFQGDHGPVAFRNI